MKKALSLLLALSMVMSFFTVSAFATEEETEPTAADVVANVTVSATGVTGQSYASGALNVKYAYGSTAPTLTTANFTVTLKSGYTLASEDPVSYAEGTLTVSYTVDADETPDETTDGDSGSTDGGSETTGGDVTTPTTQSDSPSEDGSGTSDVKTVSIGVTLTAEAKYTATVNISAPGSAAFTKANVTVPSGVTLGELTTTTTHTGISYADGKFTITDATQVTSKTYTYTFTGTANTTDDETGVDATVTVTLNVTAATLGVSKTITNGDSQTYSFAALASDIADQLKTLTSAETAPTVTGITIGAPASTSIFKLSDGSEATGGVTLGSSDSLTIAAKAGCIGSETLNLTVTANGATYTGTLTLKSDYKGSTITVSQEADFSREWFYLDSISGIAKVQKYDSSAASTSCEDSDVTSVTSYKVTPKTTDWTEELIGYDTNNVACRVDVRFEAAAYDMGAVVSGSETLFTADAFDAFVKAVNKEQSNDYAVSFDTVTFTTVSVSGKWCLYNGSAKLSSTAKLSASDLKNVTIDVTKAGTYDIPFTVSFKYYPTSASTSAGSDAYDGIFRVIAADGDIQYEVSYGESVTFRTADFQSFYRTAAGSSSATLTTVTFDELPWLGTLYTVPGQVTGGYRATTSTVFYAVPTSTQLALSGATYTAAYSPKTEYSVYIPFTASGSSGEKTGMVEIVVNRALPFTDITEEHTFYEYIGYVYRNGIMNGKTTTTFDASSSVTRVQLVTTLYRMSGSPSTYNSRVLSFSDTTGLSTEFANAVKWAVANKLVEGYDDGTFQPYAAVSRQAMVTVLYRYAKSQSFSVGVESNTNLARFKDSGKVSAKMTEAMNWAVENGFVGGTTAGYLNPAGSTTRGAAAKILAVFHQTYIG